MTKTSNSKALWDEAAIEKRFKIKSKNVTFNIQNTLNPYCLGYNRNLTVGWNEKVGSFLSDSDAPDWWAMENKK